MTTPPALPASAGPSRLSPAALGILVMLAAMFLFSLNDAMGKWLVATYTVGQVLLIRSAAALVVLAPFLRGAPVMRIERPGLQAVRAAFTTAEVFCFYWAVQFLPLADVMTYWLAAPIYVAAAAPFLLGERVGPLRWTAIAIGFVGVLIALEPFGGGSGHLGATVVALIGSGCFAALMLSGRALRGTPDQTLVFWQTMGALIAGAVLAPFGWVKPTLLDFGLLALLGIVAMAAHVMVNRALKLADAAVVAPFQYTLLLWAVILGWIFFGDVPRPMMLAGAAVIVAAGLFIFFRERAVARRRGTR
ncbi:MAG: DMT family transporter [Gemmobacter sp.]